MALETLVTNDYGTWTQSVGGWALRVLNTYAKGSSGMASYALYNYEIKKAFVLDAAARESSLTVKAEVYVADADPGPGETKLDGSAEASIVLKDPSGVETTLWWVEGDYSLQTALNALDIKAYCLLSGTYYLIFRGAVRSCRIIGVYAERFFQSYIQFFTVSLQINASTIEYELELTEELALKETVVIGLTFVEALNLTEHFTCAKTTPLASEDEKILAGKTDKAVYVFATGTPEGIWDSDDLDFGLPHQDKTLAEVQVESHAEAPHTVQIWLSTDSGKSWTYFDQCSVGTGLIGYLFPWMTAEKFRVRFKGDGLHLCSMTLWAIPRGTEVRP